MPRTARHRGGAAGKRGINAEQIPVLLVRDRSGQTANFQLAKLDAAHVMAKRQPLVDRVTGIAHRPINIRQGPRIVEGVFHIQNVNAYDTWIKGWMRRFHGVATKYLENYLGLRRMLEWYKNFITPSTCLAEAVGLPLYS